MGRKVGSELGKAADLMPYVSFLSGEKKSFSVPQFMHSGLCSTIHITHELVFTRKVLVIQFNRVCVCVCCVMRDVAVGM